MFIVNTSIIKRESIAFKVPGVLYGMVNLKIKQAYIKYILCTWNKSLLYSNECDTI